MSVAEVRRLGWRLGWGWWPPSSFVLAWSRWRRRHQDHATASHYRRRLATTLQLQL
jgi:hypothetical protein